MQSLLTGTSKEKKKYQQLLFYIPEAYKGGRAVQQLTKLGVFC